MRVVAAAFCAALVAIAAVGPATAEEPLEYVALGDSAAAGPLIPVQEPNPVCLRSDHNYPSVAADLLGARLTDVSCSGATVDDFSGSQAGSEPPQYAALSRDTDLVTVTIGGNDVSLVRQALSCVNFFPEPIGASCADKFTIGGRDVIAEAIAAWAPRLGTALEEIHTRAPSARVVVVGYGTYIRSGGCYPTQPLWARDATYIQRSVNRLSSAMREQAAAHGASFVDLAPVSTGHDSCADPADRYIEGLVPVSEAAPLHPNAAGMQVFGQEVARAVASQTTLVAMPASMTSNP